MAAMSQRFTPVTIQSVRSGLLHSQRQKVNKRVDEYAQDLSRSYQTAHITRIVKKLRPWAKQFRLTSLYQDFYLISKQSKVKEFLYQDMF